MNMFWICPICSSSNENISQVCFVCDYERKRKRIPIEETEAIYKKGCTYYQSKNYEKAFECLSFASEQKHVPALIKIAQCYRLGHGTDVSERKAYEALLQAAKKGDCFSQHEVAKCYHNGYGTAKKNSRAVIWLEKAVEQGYYPSMILLATILLDGEGVPMDGKRALELYKKAEELCLLKCSEVDPDIILGIGRCLQLEGKSIKAAIYFKKAAKAGNPEAQYNLALCYLSGNGVFKSEKKAEKWLALASEKGCSNAFWKLYELRSKAAK